jgi:hypothetical protein
MDLTNTPVSCWGPKCYPQTFSYAFGDSGRCRNTAEGGGSNCQPLTLWLGPAVAGNGFIELIHQELNLVLLHLTGGRFQNEGDPNWCLISLSYSSDWVCPDGDTDIKYSAQKASNLGSLPKILIPHCRLSGYASQRHQKSSVCQHPSSGTFLFEDP